MLETYQAPVTLHEILKLLNKVLGLVNSKRRLQCSRRGKEAEESGLKYFLHTFRTALTVGSTYSFW